MSLSPASFAKELNSVLGSGLERGVLYLASLVLFATISIIALLLGVDLLR